MTDEDTKIEEAFKQCSEARLPADFADRLVRRVRENAQAEKSGQLKGLAARIVLVAASVTLLLGFAPMVFDRSGEDRAAEVAQVDAIRPAHSSVPQDGQLSALGLLGFCHEIVRRRVKPLVNRFRRRREDDQTSD